MKTVIVALNSKFIHSALAPWYLKANCMPECGEVKVMEYSINEMIDSVLAGIYEESCDIAAFSCYIWNIEYVLKIADNLKKVLPKVKIILGGPEVSFNAFEIMDKNSCIDYILSGEGELTFGQLLRALINKSIEPDSIKSLTYRDGDHLVLGEEYAIIEDLNMIRSPYSEEMFYNVGNKIVYYESSRGCPFDCSYCLSSTFKGVRYLSMERVKSDILAFIKAGIKMVKFVDRTFNCNLERAKQILSFVIDNAGSTHFHFEAAADLFDNEMMDILSKAPTGLIQFEIGIQTTNSKTLIAVNRKTRLNEVFFNVQKLNRLGNVHLHLDLIVGLPYEDYESFRKSFNDVYELGPQQLQVGFLKLLKGSRIRAESDKYGYNFRNYPPYEVLSSNYLSFGEISKLKCIEDMVERFLNSGRFNKTIDYLIKGFFASPFDFYEKLSKYFKRSGYFDRSLSSRDLYTIVLEFAQKIEIDIDLKIVNELLKFDFLLSNNTNNLPAGLTRNMDLGFKEKCFDFLKNEEYILKYIPHFEGIPAKQIYNKVHFEMFLNDITNENVMESKNTVILFDYTNSNDVTGHFNFSKVPIA
ncbi:B12-binding domain-containing radical SAM protein [Acetivibrio cellulolyticus]|uniref:B12-binding domain-containing radical SAM protein n=1 Tax=Acetivibrio cellulolyticus TaxID=35830 RepID=UPI0001E2D0A2|nr:B12-binding domain-containing radical SAM protein [Acetivibrio cellulolyticus]